MSERIKIHKAMCFPPGALAAYLNTKNGCYDKLDYEILIALTYRKVIESVKKYKNYYIYFPPRDGAEKELNNLINTNVGVGYLGKFIKKYIEESTTVDVAYIQPGEGNSVVVYPCQIKRFGIHTQHRSTTDFLVFLESLKLFTCTQVTLLIVIENGPNLNFEEIFDYFSFNTLPFREIVISFEQKNIISFIQVFPTNNNEYGILQYSKKEILTYSPFVI